MPRIFMNTGTEDIFRGSSIGKMAMEAARKASMRGGWEDIDRGDITESPDSDTTVTIESAGMGDVFGEPYETEPRFKLEGYVVEKQRVKIVTRRGGGFSTSWIDCPVQYVSNPSYAGFRDYSVAYGKQYRYRIRSIWKCITSREGGFGAEYEELRQRLVEKIPQCKAAIDMFVKPYISVYYKSNPTNWVHAIILDDKPPISTDILIRPNSHKRSIVVSWLCPPDRQRDIDYFYVWKKKRGLGGTWPTSWTEAYRSKGNIDNVFIDPDTAFDMEYLYTVQVVDKHGFRSKLSAQVVAKMNKSFYYDGFEHEPWLWNFPGKDIKDTTKTVENRSVLFCKKNFKIKTKPQFTESEKKFYIRVTSLDTGESMIIPLIIKNMPLMLEDEDTEL